VRPTVFVIGDAGQQALAVVEAAASGGDHLLRSGGITELGWLTAQDGYAIFEASSKDQVHGMVHSFYPFYKQEIHEIVPWEQGKQAILASARQMASR